MKIYVLDPTKALIAFVGFVSDWVLTREWSRLLFSMILPGLLFCVAGLTWVGGSLDRQRLAAWYLELGDTEIRFWEDAWAPKMAASRADPASSGNSKSNISAAAPSALESSETESASGASSLPTGSQITPFAEMLFRRAQLVEPSQESLFVIGAMLAQRGALEQAVKMLTRVAPKDRVGQPKAHAFLALIYRDQFQQSGERQFLPLIKHHAAAASNWERVPEDVLVLSSELAWMDAEARGLGTLQSREPLAAALSAYQKAAQRNPDRYVDLFKRAWAAQNVPLSNQAMQAGTKHFQGKLADNAADDLARANLAELSVLAELNLNDSGGIQRAEDLLREGELIERTPLIARSLSEVYRVRFLQSFSKADGVYSAKVELLDMAMRLDPTNPRVPEEVAKLGQLEGGTGFELSDELVEKLNLFLAEGKATTATHAWLSKIHLARKQYDRAVVHLEQVVTRLPTASQYLNNLAYVLADQFPERLEESLQYAQRAVVSAQRNPNADYFDTLGFVYAKLGKTKESIAALETAIQLDPQRIAFHERVAAQYRLQGNEQLAEVHVQVINRLRAEAASE